MVIVIYGHQQAEFAAAIYSCLLHNIPYIPVDCIYPQERLKEICQLASAPYYYDVATRQFIATDVTEQALVEQDLAYIMFTSGSTGKPKGVQIGRESLWHFMKWVRQDFALPEVPVLMNHAVFSFALSDSTAGKSGNQRAYRAECERGYRRSLAVTICPI